MTIMKQIMNIILESINYSVFQNTIIILLITYWNIMYDDIKFHESINILLTIMWMV